MTPEQAAVIADHAGQMNQRFGQYLLHAWTTTTPDDLEIGFFYADDDDLVAAEAAYFEEIKGQLDGPLVAEFADEAERLAAEGG